MHIHHSKLKRLNVVFAYFLLVLLTSTLLVLFLFDRKLDQQGAITHLVDQQIKRIQAISISPDVWRWKGIHDGHLEIKSKCSDLTYGAQWETMLSKANMSFNYLQKEREAHLSFLQHPIVKKDLIQYERQLEAMYELLILKFRRQNSQLIDLAMGLVFAISLLVFLGIILITRPLFRHLNTKNKALENAYKTTREKEVELRDAMMELSNTQEHLVIHENRYRTITEKMSNVILLLNEDAKIIYVSPSCLEQLGYEVADLLQAGFSTLITRDNHQDIEQHLEGISEEEIIEVPVQWIRYDEVEVWMQMKIQRVQGMVDASFLISAQNIESEIRAENLLKGTQDIARLGGFEIDFIKQSVEWTSQMNQIHELGEGFEISFDKLPALYGLNNQSALMTFLDLDENTACFQKEFQIPIKAGEFKWVRALGHVEFENQSITKLVGTLQDVDEQVKVAKMLEDKSLMVEQIMKASPNFLMVVEARKQEVIYTKGSVNRVLKLEGEEADWRKYLHAEDRRSMEEMLASSSLDLQTTDKLEMDLRLKNAERKNHWFHLTVSPFRRNEKEEVTELLFTLFDIQLKKERDEKLRRNVVSLKTFVGEAPAAIAMLDQDLKFLAVSERFREDYRTKDRQLVGQSYHTVFPDSPAYMEFLLKRGLKGIIEEEEEMQVFRCDGKEEWARWEMRPWFTDDYEIGGIILFSHFITEDRKLRGELIEAKERAEEASRTKAQFLSTMSHEIRTPMNAVVGLSHLLIEENPRPEQLEYLSKLKFSAESLLGLINDILDFSKIESGKLEIESITFNLWKDVKGVYDMLFFKAQEKKILLKYFIEEDVPKMVIGDPVRIRQILVNLVNNAIKFTPVGMVEIKVSATSVGDNACQIKFQVIDTGIGIPEDKVDAIFQSFSQVSAETTRKFGGTGLGLTITKKLCEMQGGSVSVSSELEVGSKFTVQLPYRLPDSVEERAEEKQETTTMGEDLEGVRVLLVEDNTMNQFVAKKFLSKFGVIVQLAQNGVEAVEMVQKNKFDMVLMDLEMPIMDGFEATKKIKSFKEDYYQKLPILALTASALSEVQKRVYDWGMVDFITKPFDPKIFYNKLLKHYRPKKKDGLPVLNAKKSP
ncbi:ATP-binding protein [Persicobacter sp. CCB-QB2]|uniref:ATP-binding protein n=1 Tax=Persicobacter sp. CCB-QB2 TaxID=1561025 RepID=UPI0006A9BF84|nr:ATP-binding protein [Persicobacter sp. CCB-QB2]